MIERQNKLTNSIMPQLEAVTPGSGVYLNEADFQDRNWRSEEHTSELQSRLHLVCRLLLEKKKRAQEWNNSLKTKLSLLPKKLFRIRMSLNFGMKMLTMTNLSTECLIQLTKLGYDATTCNQILKQNAKREMRLRLGKVTVADVLAAFFF